MKGVDLKKLNRDVLEGKSGGRIIWQPRIGCWYNDKIFLDERLPEPYDGLTLPEIFKKLGCSARDYEYLDCFKQIDDPRVVRHSRAISDTLAEHIVETPVGSLTTVIRSNKSNGGVYPEIWPVKSVEDLKIDAWVQERTEYAFDRARYDEVYKKWGGMGLTATAFPKVSVQRLTQEAMGLEGTIYAIADYPGAIDGYLRVINENQKKLVKLMSESPVECINFGGHGDCRLLSPNMMREYLLPVCREMNDVFHKAGKFTFSHWDGEVKPLLPFVKELGFDAIEAITPEPQGDVTLEEMKGALGDDIFLIDGIAAILFDPLFPVERLISQVKKLIELFAPKLILGISDELPSRGDIERIRIVGDIVDEYNAQFIR